MAGKHSIDREWQGYVRITTYLNDWYRTLYWDTNKVSLRKPSHGWDRKFSNPYVSLTVMCERAVVGGYEWELLRLPSTYEFEMGAAF